MEKSGNEAKKFAEVWRKANLIDYVLADLERRLKGISPLN